jgi:hypothetical protein
MLLLENEDFREFIALLNSNAVKFLIVGGHAVTFHGFPQQVERTESSRRNETQKAKEAVSGLRCARAALIAAPAAISTQSLVLPCQWQWPLDGNTGAK